MHAAHCCSARRSHVYTANEDMFCSTTCSHLWPAGHAIRASSGAACYGWRQVDGTFKVDKGDLDRYVLRISMPQHNTFRFHSV